MFYLERVKARKISLCLQIRHLKLNINNFFKMRWFLLPAEFKGSKLLHEKYCKEWAQRARELDRSCLFHPTASCRSQCRVSFVVLSGMVTSLLFPTTWDFSCPTSWRHFALWGLRHFFWRELQYLPGAIGVGQNTASIQSPHGERQTAFGWWQPPCGVRILPNSTSSSLCTFALGAPSSGNTLFPSSFSAGLA